MVLRIWRSASRAEKALVALFLLTLPFVQARVRGDGIGYYAYARSLLIDHNLQFRGDWKDSTQLPVLMNTGSNGHVVSVSAYTSTGHVANFYPIGPAILWAPFLMVTHAGVLAARHLGFSVAADGFSSPYLLTMALATATYAFVGVWLSFRLAREYFGERWAFLAALGIWFGTSLPAYMYVDSAWSHAHSAFAVSLLVWYWHRTRPDRTPAQWLTLGLVSGLMLDVYFANAAFLLLPFADSLAIGKAELRNPVPGSRSWLSFLRLQIIYAVGLAVAFAPTMMVRKIVFGSAFAAGGYANRRWNLTSPRLWAVLFSSQHGLLVWTPILVPAIIGLLLICWQIGSVGKPLAASTLVFYLLISIYPWWDGVASFGNRFFVSLTPVFVLGLAAALSAFARWWRDQKGATWRLATVSALLIVWNLGLVFQWSTGLMPSVGPVSWSEVLYNQVRVVPQEVVHSAERKLIAYGEAPKASVQH